MKHPHQQLNHYHLQLINLPPQAETTTTPQAETTTTPQAETQQHLKLKLQQHLKLKLFPLQQQQLNRRLEHLFQQQNRGHQQQNRGRQTSESWTPVQHEVNIPDKVSFNEDVKMNLKYCQTMMEKK